MKKSFTVLLSLLLTLVLFPLVTASTAVIEASPTTVYLNEPVGFDGSGSDPSVGNIVRYYFDYGDNLSSGWIDSPVIKHQYPQPGIYYARLKVKDSREDKYGLESNWSTPPVNIIVKGQLPVVNVTVPNVVRLSMDEAVATIENAGLTAGNVTWQASSAPVGTVLGQRPIAGAVVSSGSRVGIVVAKETETPLTLGLAADPGEINTGGERSTIIITLLRGGVEVKASSDTEIHLSTTLGKITSRVIIPEGKSQGTAVLESSSKNGTAEITATSEDLTPGYAEVEFIAEEMVIPTLLVLESDVSSLPSDGESTSIITVTLTDDEGNPVTAEEDITIYLKATGGRVEPSPVTIKKGSAFTTITFISPEEPGMARIFAASRGFEEAVMGIEIYPPFVEVPYYEEGIGDKDIIIIIIALLLGMAAGTAALVLSRKKGYFKIEVKPRLVKEESSFDEGKPFSKKPRKVNEISSISQKVLEENKVLLFSQRQMDAIADKALENTSTPLRFRLANFLAGPNRINDDETREEIKEFFKIDICELLIRIWKKANALREFTDHEKYPCENTYQLTLLTHKMTSKCELSFDVLLNKIRVLRIPFELNIELNTKGFKMWTRCGRIVKLFSGSMKGTVIIKTGAFKIMEKDTDDIKIPGEVSFKDGIEIPKRLYFG